MPVTVVGGGTYFACENTKNFTEAKTKEKRYLLWTADPNKEYKEVVLPSTLKCVGSRCFSAVKINKVVVPKQVIYMGGGTGLGFANLTDAQISDFAAQVQTAVSLYD